MSLPVVFLFSGQGSHFRGMGRELLAGEPGFAEEWRRFESLLVDRGARPAVDAMESEDPQPWRTLTETHPALMWIQTAAAKALSRSGVRPSACLGYSHGELAALFASGRLGMEAVVDQSIGEAELVDLSPPGTLIAALAPAERLQGRPAFAGLRPAADNFPGHSVWSAEEDRAKDLLADLKAARIAAQALDVPRAFHSDSVLPAREPIRRLSKRLRFSPSSVAVWSCALGRAIGEADRPEDLLWERLYLPVRFRETALRLAAEGPKHWIDCGPGATLVNFLRKNGLSEGHRFSSLFPRMGKRPRTLEEALDPS